MNFPSSAFARSAAVLAGFLLCACTDEDGARRAIENLGLTPQSVGGFAAFRCGQDDTFATRFTAQTRDGKPITGTVCSGFLKGSTVRFD